MNLPNLLTLSRIPMMFVIAALLYVPWAERPPAGLASAALVVYILAGITDWLDGAVARRRGIVTRFGMFMDALSDKIFMLGVMVVLVSIGAHPLLLPLVLVVLVREMLITGMRLLAANRGVVVAAEKAGKQKTVTQIIAVGILIAEHVVVRDVAAWAGGGFGEVARWIGLGGLAVFLLATYMTVRSGATYLLKYRSLWQEP
jgi:CDP-diacylglycerol--glycerol-3-phosphate 3-phosphatidyltransferase